MPKLLLWMALLFGFTLPGGGWTFPLHPDVMLHDGGSGHPPPNPATPRVTVMDGGSGHPPNP